MQDRLERVMARLLSDAEFRQRFRTDPHTAAAEEGLSSEAVAAMAAISLPDLETAARGYASQRRAKREQGRRSWLKRLFGRR
jgi:hypothetical protein